MSASLSSSLSSSAITTSVLTTPVSSTISATTDTGNDIDARLALTETETFRDKLNAELKQAKTFIQERVQSGEKGFVIFDVDETSLDNRTFYRDPHKIYYKDSSKDFYTAWDSWILKGEAPALQPTKQLIEWLNNEAIPYCFVTGRTQEQQAVTLRNLKQARLIGESYKGIYCKSNDWRATTTAAHKKSVVPKIELELGLKAMASIGDRPDDMMLPEKERNFKLSSSAFYPSRS